MSRPQKPSPTQPLSTQAGPTRSGPHRVAHTEWPTPTQNYNKEGERRGLYRTGVCVSTLGIWFWRAYLVLVLRFPGLLAF